NHGGQKTNGRSRWTVRRFEHCHEQAGEDPRHQRRTRGPLGALRKSRRWKAPRPPSGQEPRRPTGTDVDSPTLFFAPPEVDAIRRPPNWGFGSTVRKLVLRSRGNGGTGWLPATRPAA